MFGFRYLKFPPTTYVLQFRAGRIRREGAGQSFFYFAPRSTIVAVPAGSTDVPFAFTETTADYQTVTVQGHLTFRVVEPRKLAELLDFSIRPGGAYASEDPQKLVMRVSQAAQNATRSEIASRPLLRVLVEGDVIARTALGLLRQSTALSALGVSVLELSLLAIKPQPETAKALEAKTRELFLREADDALYLRRNNAVEQERKIKENELATEVAVQSKRREIEETRLNGQIAVEEKRAALVAAETANSRAQADAAAYALKASLEPLAAVDPKALQVLAARGLDPRQLLAMAFQELAAGAARIGNLNVTPDLLQSLLRDAEAAHPKP